MAHYFVDGYNVIRNSEWLSQGALREQRDRLLRFIEEKRPHGRNSVTVVFDGRSDVSSPPHAGEAQVLFSVGRDADDRASRKCRGGTADDVIKQRVDDLSNPRAAVIVTDDRAIQKWVRGVGARILACAEFLKAGENSPVPRRRPSRIEPEAAREITEELRRVWKIE